MLQRLPLVLALALFACAHRPASTARDGDRAAPRQPARVARGMPAWFREGMRTTNAADRVVALNVRPRPADVLGATAQLDGRDASPVYASADRAFGYLARRYGWHRLELLLARVREGAAFSEAFRSVLGVTVEAFEDDFRSYLVQERTRG